MSRRRTLQLPIVLFIGFIFLCFVQFPAFRDHTASTATDYFAYGSSFLNPGVVGQGASISNTITDVGAGASVAGPPKKDSPIHSPEEKLPTSSSVVTEPASLPVESVEVKPKAAEEGTKGEAEAEENEKQMDFKDPGIVPQLVRSIMDLSDTTVPRMSCHSPIGARYNHLKPEAKPASASPTDANSTIRYFLALDLFEVAALLPRLMGSVVEVMRHLGPENCALSIVEGRSQDITYKVLDALREPLAGLGVPYTLTTSSLDPKHGEVNRIEALAELRNLALRPLLTHPELYDAKDTTVIFLNDIAVCPHDILELVHQQFAQGADMSCAMDWIPNGPFYDVWVSRGINGDTFFEIPQNAGWEFAGNLFWSDSYSKTRYEKKAPVQVYACWNGIAVFTATPLLSGGVSFRQSVEKECYMGEPTLLCKDFWRQGRGKIMIVPTINVGYNDADGAVIKEKQGSVEDSVDVKTDVGLKRDEGEAGGIKWQIKPPGAVKCLPEFQSPSWVGPL